MDIPVVFVLLVHLLANFIIRLLLQIVYGAAQQGSSDSAKTTTYSTPPKKLTCNLKIPPLWKGETSTNR